MRTGFVEWEVYNEHAEKYEERLKKIEANQRMIARALDFTLNRIGFLFGRVVPHSENAVDEIRDYAQDLKGML